MNSEPTESAQRIPLPWASGRFISRDGVVSRADGTALKDIPLFQARQYARKSIDHDPPRKSVSGVPHGRGGFEALVALEDGTQVVRTLRLLAHHERAQLANEGAVSMFMPEPIRAEGNVESGWYWMRADDGAFWLFHGPSYAMHLLTANQ
jgi:hypothetical protein